MFRKMASLEAELRREIKAKDDELNELRPLTLKCSQLQDRLEKSEVCSSEYLLVPLIAQEMAAWLNASIHEKNKRIDTLTSCLSTISHAVKSANIMDPSGSAHSSPSHGRDFRIPDSISVEEANGDRISPIHGDGVILHGLEQSGDDADGEHHFSILDSDEEDDR